MPVIFKSKRGGEIPEASVTMPLIIIITLLLIRTVLFFYDVLDTRVDLQLELLEEAKSYDKCYIKTDERKAEVMMTGNIISTDVFAEIKLYSESKIITMGDLIE